MGAPQVVVMGVSGCGKSTLGRGLAQALGVRYVEGDELHPPRNIERMAAGIPLTDEDRQDWLQAVGAQLSTASAAGEGLVVTCSALRRSYRDGLRAAAPGLRLVYLRGDEALLAQRLTQRQGHYMPASLLQSQLQTLEPPAADEQPIELDIAAPSAELLAVALRALGPA
ncbi:MAG: gluconokinase [Rubrivivax sp.]|nr:gluconokinase [Rubrivivax sp.]